MQWRKNHLLCCETAVDLKYTVLTKRPWTVTTKDSDAVYRNCGYSIASFGKALKLHNRVLTNQLYTGEYHIIRVHVY